MTHPAFEHLRSRAVPALKLELQEYRHRATGARHVHLASDDPHKAFLVAFLTVPQDSTGVAHILEHTALCGSRRYPVRDPFFMMTRRSLNTFMNAFTGADWTAYPFASLNRKDFENLLDVYLDAAFFPLLDPLDFAQEGHRVEFADDSADAPLVFKGVVYNEMKGAMSSPVQALAQRLQSALFPTTTYHHNSGGEPGVIPDLTHERLVAFHGAHYHPSNAVFMSYGDLPAAELQQHFEERALSAFTARPLDLAIPDERRYDAPVAVEAPYAADAEALADGTHVVLGWLLGRTTDPLETARARVLSDVLLDNSSSPLRHALETSELGAAPSPLCGFDDSTRETTFTCGLEGCAPDTAAAVEQLVLETITRVAEDGVAPEVVESVLHQLELQSREISGDGYPYGLKLMLDALTPLMHGGDPLDGLDIDPVLAELRREAAEPGFIPQLARRLLLDNPHRVRLSLKPDPELAARQAAAEIERLAALRAQLDAEAQQQVRAQAAALAARQARHDDPALLPKVTLADVPAELAIATGETRQLNGVETAWYAQPTNGLVYQQWVIDLPALDPGLAGLVPLYALTLSEVGSAGRDYQETQALQAAVTGGLSARCLVRAAVDDPQQLRAVLVLAGKALARNAGALTQLLRDTLLEPRFDELDRLAELVAQYRAQRDEEVVDHGHALAMGAASEALSPAGALISQWGGLTAIERLRELDDALSADDDEADAALATYAQRLAALHARVLCAPRRLLVVAEAGRHGELAELIATHGAGPAAAGTAVTLAPVLPDSPPVQAWTLATQVSFCARAYPAVAAGHPDAPALVVLGDFLRNGFLHRAIRERGGAYGAGAGLHADSGSFRFFSYRDPRLAETLADFDASIDWLLRTPHEAQPLEEAILGVVAAIDRPGSPAGEAINAWFSELFGRTPEQRRRFRARVLAVTIEDLQRVARTWLRPELARTAVITSAAALAASGLNAEVRTL